MRQTNAMNTAHSGIMHVSLDTICEGSPRPDFALILTATHNSKLRRLLVAKLKEGDHMLM